MELNLPKNNTELNFVLHEHELGGKIDYQLSIETEPGELQFLKFPRNGKMATISDNPNITRLFGELQEDTRSREWLDFDGTTLKPETLDNVDDEIQALHGDYRILETGQLRVGDQTAKFSELFFNEQHISGRWILRKIPNIFDKSYLSDPEVYLFWKPPKQKDYANAYDIKSHYSEQRCPCGVAEASANFAELTKVEGEWVSSKLQMDFTFDNASQTFEGVGAAEGTWIDMFGVKYLYTPEFITHTFNKQRIQAQQGQYTLNTEHDKFGESFDGHVTAVELRQEPIKHIVVKGTYTGPSALSEGEVGLSNEFRLKSVWHEDFQAWVPFDSITDKLSVVKRPACKICWITKVN